MKVTMPKNWKMYTGYQIDNMKAVIAYEKDDEWNIKDWAEMAVREALKDTNDFLKEIVTATAEAVTNSRAWNEYGNESGDGDVWITALAETYDGFIRVQAYLTDIWQTGAVDYKRHEYIEYFKRTVL